MVTEKILAALGEFPPKVAVNATLDDYTECDDYYIKKVFYSVDNNERIWAYLLIPKSVTEKLPAIVAIHQHAGEYFVGKSEPVGLYKNGASHFAVELCKRGYAVICPDNLCFEDRRPKEYEVKDNPFIEGDGYERFEFIDRLLNGSTLQAKYISDLCRAVDVLEELDFVDKNRIGVCGHSLGGQEALWLGWYDKRIKAVVTSCGCTQLKTIQRDRLNHTFTMYVPGLLKFGDMSDVVCCMAPKPFFMANGIRDLIFPIDGAKEIMRLAAKQYEIAGFAQNFKGVVFDDGHVFTEEVRCQAYNFLDKFLMQS